MKNSLWEYFELKITTTLTIFSWQMKQIFILLAMSILRTDGIEQLRTLAMFIGNLYILRMFCLVVCSIFWVDRSPVLWRRGRQSSNPLNQDASHISGTGFADTWCWSADCLVSKRRGNGSHCEECNASSHRGVTSQPYLTKTGLLNGLQGRSISTPATSSSGNISGVRCMKSDQGQRRAWKRTSAMKQLHFLPSCSNESCRNFRNDYGNMLQH